VCGYMGRVESSRVDGVLESWRVERMVGGTKRGGENSGQSVLENKLCPYQRAMREEGKESRMVGVCFAFQA